MPRKATPVGPIGDILAQTLRLAAQDRVSMRKIGRLAGISGGQVWSILHGEKPMRVDQYIAISSALRIDPSALLRRAIAHHTRGKTTVTIRDVPYLIGEASLADGWVLTAMGYEPEWEDELTARSEEP